jgi:hypothetical protein
MRGRLSFASGLGLACLLLGFASAADADSQIRRLTEGSSSLTIRSSRLASLGLSMSEIRQASAGDDRTTFAVVIDEEVTFRTRNDGFAGFTDDYVTLAHAGGFVLRVENPTLGRLVSRTALFDFSVEVDPRDAVLATIRDATDVRPAPFEVRNGGFGFDAATGELVVRGADLVIAADWARATGQPGLAGKWLGAFDLRIASKPVQREVSAVAPREPRGAPPVIDVLLNEVYGITEVGRRGTYPTGALGLSFATTSCNNGTVDVPWHGPMAEDHPFIGLAMFREMNGRMEMIGRSWLKHGFFALANDQCDLGCVGGGGGYLIVACSDTYSVANNASQFYLGPRDEVNPHTGDWSCLGSWFDGIPVDCVRDELGNDLDPVDHRLEVSENELDLPGARYFYEGVYYVKDDDLLFNNFGWRECTMNWTGTEWDFADVGAGLLANPGPFMLNWGQQQHTEQVASDDGFVILSEEITELGGGNWHYEYALYNQTSARAVESFSVPSGDAVISNAGFRDIDQDSGNEWTFSVANGSATWDTAPFGSPGTTNPLEYQSVFNFWFDANCAPAPGSALLTIHRPGVGTHVLVDVSSPGGITDVLAGPSRTSLTLFPSEPNPFLESTRISFAIERAAPVHLYVTDVTGRIVRNLLDGVAPRGTNALRWDGRDDAGTKVASGIYFFRLESEAGSRTTKGILLR